MARFKSFKDLQAAQTSPAPPVGKVQVAVTPSAIPTPTTLRVSAEVDGDSGLATLQACRSAVLRWIRDSLGRDLPRKAWRHKTFHYDGDQFVCRGARAQEGDSDEWAVKIETSLGSGKNLTLEVVLASAPPRRPLIGITVEDRSVIPGMALSGSYPAEILAAVSKQASLTQDGRPIARRAIHVDSDMVMDGFLRMISDPNRSLPFAVISVDEHDDDLETVEARARDLARALTGLAVTWVLPTEMTFRLSDALTRQNSVFNGAWRFYRLNFHRAGRRDPLVLSGQIERNGVAKTIADFVTYATEEVARSGPGVEWPSYEAIYRRADVPAKPGNLFLQWAGRVWPQLVREPAPEPTREAELKPEPAPTPIPDPRLQSELFAARQEVAHLQERLELSEDRLEQTRKRLQAVEENRDAEVRHANRLADALTVMGGDPNADVLIPDTWDQFAQWCGAHLQGRLALTPSARREIDQAEFLNVGLAARCLAWLAHTYRDGRLGGGSPQLYGRIKGFSEGVSNERCGGDSFECQWHGRRHPVEWHIKGGNSRDPRHCLRIYYFWDERTRSVVVASMPAHRRTAMS